MIIDDTNDNGVDTIGALIPIDMTMLVKGKLL